MDVWLTVGLGIILFLVIVAGVLAYLVWPITIGAMYQPSSKTIIRRMLEMAEVTQNDIIYDLGSGDGRILFLAATKFGAKAVGIEADPIRFYRTKRKIERLGLGHQVHLIHGNFFKQNLADATVIIIFQSQRVNQKLKPKLLEELRPETRIVSNLWTFEGWQPVKVDKGLPIYLYQIHSI